MKSSKPKKSKRDLSMSPVRRKYIQEISSEDYYRKSSEFRLWLKERKNIYFNDLDKQEQRKYFDKFVSKWNRGRLNDKYYDGISTTQISKHESTGFKWNFASKIDESELDRIRDTVDTDTNKYTKKSSLDKLGRIQSLAFPSHSIKSRTDALLDEEEVRAEEKLKKRREIKSLRKDHDVVLEELVPKETGREAMLEKKRIKADYTRREKSPDVILNDNELMGTSDDYHTALAREKQKQTRWQEKKQQIEKEKADKLKERMATYQAKEDATMQMLRNLAKENQSKYN